MVELNSLHRESLVSLTVDVEWAHPRVLMDVVSMLDQRGLRATFFCTHAGIDVPGHERAIHPNFRRENNSVWGDPAVRKAAGRGETEYWQTVVSAFQRFCPEAIGVRSHGLFYDSRLLGVYQAAGLRYDSSCFMPLARGLQPVWIREGILELPIYYMDFWDISERATGFRLDGVRLEEPGLRVLCFHPNLIYANQCCPGKVAPSDGKSRPLNVLWPVLPGNDLKSRGRKWSPERSIRTRHNEG